MEEHTAKTINAFDSCFATRQSQMMKILFSHLPPKHRGSFAVYIKLMELLHAFSLMKNPPIYGFPWCSSGLSIDFFNGDNTESVSFLQELLQFSGPDDGVKIKNMIQMMENIKKMQEMMDMIKMMQDMFPEGADASSGFGSQNPMDFLSGMMSMDSSGMNMNDLFGLFGN